MLFEPFYFEVDFQNYIYRNLYTTTAWNRKIPIPNIFRGTYKKTNRNGKPFSGLSRIFNNVNHIKFLYIGVDSIKSFERLKSNYIL